MIYVPGEGDHTFRQLPSVYWLPDTILVMANKRGYQLLMHLDEAMHEHHESALPCLMGSVLYAVQTEDIVILPTKKAAQQRPEGS